MTRTLRHEALSWDLRIGTVENRYSFPGTCHTCPRRQDVRSSRGCRQRLHRAKHGTSEASLLAPTGWGMDARSVALEEKMSS
jgi:hypothetical protein